MKNIIFLLTLILLSSCFNKGTKDDPLIVPPKFNEIPDLKNPEKIDEKQKDADIEKLKDLLLKSE